MNVQTRSTASQRRAVAAIVVALAATACAVAAAHGPAIRQQAQYAWPPAEVATGAPTRTWVAPLFLARHRAETIDARVPCRPGATLRDSASNGTIVLLATTRDPAREDGLAVTTTQGGSTIKVSVGGTELARYASTSATECVLDVRVDGHDWTTGSTGNPTHRGRLVAPPRVVGLFTELDLRSKPPLSVTVRPIPQDTEPSGRQTALRIVAAAFLAASIVLLLWPPTRRLRWRPPRPRLAAQDGVVALTLGAWWVLAPLHFDDGWVRAREKNYSASSGFSNYYEPWGANLPMGTWLEWLQHFVVARTDSLALHRLPTILVLAVTWLVCRACLTRLIGREPTRNDPAWWSAALTFALGAAAFGVTLRPEPAISLLAVAVMLCCLRWLEHPTLWLLVLSVVLIGLAMTIHPTGAVAAAPLAVLLPRLIRDARRRSVLTGVELTAIIPIGIACVLLLAFLDADLASHRSNLDLLRDTEEHGGGLLQELQRYEAVSETGASSLRRLVIALTVLSAAAALISALTKRRLAERMPATSILLGLAIFAVAPSKWIWHFGALVGLCAVAVGIEAHRLAAVRLWRVGRWCLVFGVVIVAVWASRRPGIWGPIDTERFTSIYLIRPYAAAIVIGVGSLLVATGLRRIGRPHLSALPVVVAALLVVTTAMFAMDAAAPGAWTAARQVLSPAGMDESCGVASDLVVSVPTSALSPAGLPPARTEGGLAAPRREASRVAEPEAGEWHPLPGRSIGVFVRGLRPVDRLRVTWGRMSVDGVTRLRSGYADLGQANWGYPRWQFVAEDSFPDRPSAADVVRFDLIGPKGAPSTAELTEPLPYRRLRLSTLLEQPRAASWVSPFLYGAMPCADLPKLAYGVAETPHLLVDFNPRRLLRPSSLYAGIGDVYDLMRVPLERSEPLKYIVVYWVKPDPRDAIAPAVETIVTA